MVNLSEEQQVEAPAVAQTMLADREAELTRRLDGFESSRPRELTPYESRSLVALLHSRDRAKVARTLVTVSNCAAFTRNQDLLREAGLLVLLPSLLADPDRGVQLAAVRAASNLALNTANMKEMEQVVLVMVLKAEEQARCVQILLPTLAPPLLDLLPLETCSSCNTFKPDTSECRWNFSPFG